MTSQELTAKLKARSRELGFDLAGAAPAVDAPSWPRYADWIAAGNAGEMGYLVRRLDARRHPRAILPQVRGVLMLAMNYNTVEPIQPGPGEAAISRYAWGQDYHELIRDRLHRLAAFHRELTPDAWTRGVVDTAPLLERDYARLAGLGWIGKNTCLINRRLGSWLFLAALLTSEPLEPDAPCQRDYCGTCRRCLDACPTGALVAPRVLDARRCLSYATIELRGPIPEQLKAALGERVFGCDTCQAVCPHNRDAPCSTAREFHPRPGMNPVSLDWIQSLSAEDFEQQLGDMPLARTGLEGLQRNAAAVME